MRYLLLSPFLEVETATVSATFVHGHLDFNALRLL
jgi:hypothetical protein